MGFRAKREPGGQKERVATGAGFGVWLKRLAGRKKRVATHQQPEVNYLPRFSPQLISLERYTLSVYRAGGIDLFENLDIVHTRLLVVGCRA